MRVQAGLRSAAGADGPVGDGAFACRRSRAGPAAHGARPRNERAGPASAPRTGAGPAGGDLAGDRRTGAMVRPSCRRRRSAYCARRACGMRRIARSDQW